MITLDTDLVSALSKGGGLDLILKLFNSRVYITPEVYEELQAPLSYGYSFPQEIFEKIEVLEVSPEEQRLYLKLLPKSRDLGKGELESICVAEKRDWLFSSLDKKAIRFAQRRKVKVMVLKAILKGLWRKEICTKEEIKELVNRIEKKDQRKIDTKDVFE